MKNHTETRVRCVNIDWLEVYVLEANDRFPCNADYFRRQGYFVTEREYGTRVYKEMFVITDQQSNPLIEIRRNPASGSAPFNGLVEQSAHIRLTNWVLYQGNPVQMLREFLLRNDYIFKRIYRIDICYDFERFDSGDVPAKFVRRYLQGKYRKINQSNLTAHGRDTWNGQDYSSLSWGSKSSMVTTKLYNKTLELKEGKNDKPYIKTCWMLHGLIDNPCSMTKTDTNGNLYHPEIWRLEFSLMSEADSWLVIEMVNGKKMKKQAIPHRLDQFDAKDKIWKRFRDLAYHYFHFKRTEYIGAQGSLAEIALVSVDSLHDRQLQRKDRCRDKDLFKWEDMNDFRQLSTAPAPSKPNVKDEMLKRRLMMYRIQHPQEKIRFACDEILKNIERIDSLRFTPLGEDKDRIAWMKAMQLRLGGDTRDFLEILSQVKTLLENDMLL